MPGKIFISYRRDDVAGDARGLRDGLATRFGQHNVFMDIDNMLPGQRFDRKLAEALSACDVLIAVIGPRWLELLGARMASGEPDYARAEIGEALRRGIVVIPVRVGLDGRMPELPRPEDLPADLRDLVLHQKHDVVHEHFGRDLAALAQAIAEIRRDGRRPTGTHIAWRWVAAFVGLIAVVSAALYLAGDGRQGPAKVEKQSDKVAIAPPPKPEAAPERPAPPPVPKPERAFSPSRAAGPLTAAEERTLRPKDSFRECNVCPEMVVVPTGRFAMGSPENDDARGTNEGPLHTVEIATPIAVAKFEATFDEWAACVAAGGCNAYVPKDEGWGRGRRPVIHVSWHDAKEYVGWLSKKTGHAYRLLTEAEWEYAARAGAATPFFFGEDSALLCKFANGADQLSTIAKERNAACSDGFADMTAPVGAFSANAFGLHDTVGNVWEWVEDCYTASYEGAPSDGSARMGGTCATRVVRGGSWLVIPRGLRTAFRVHLKADYRDDDVGFRVARDLAPYRG